jgi:hypothetical protein
MTYLDILKTDPGYTEWLLKQRGLQNPEMKMLQAYAHMRRKGALTKQTLSELLGEDLSKNPFKRGSKMYSTAEDNSDQKRDLDEEVERVTGAYGEVGKGLKSSGSQMPMTPKTAKGSAGEQLSSEDLAEFQEFLNWKKSQKGTPMPSTPTAETPDDVMLREAKRLQRDEQ